jgi:hypothetical protein
MEMKEGILGAALVPLMLSACATTDSDAPPARLNPSAAAIDYALPSVSSKLTVQLVLLQCDQGPLATSVFAVVNEAGADQQRRHRLSGSALGSALKRRELAVELYEAGTLKSVNAAVEDRTGAVIANVFNLLTSGFGVFRAATAHTATPGASSCNEPTRRALQEVQDLEKRIGVLRASALAAAPEKGEAIQKQINNLAARVGTLRSNELSIGLTRPLEIGTAPGTEKQIRWTMADLAKWFATDPVREPCAQHPAFRADPDKRGCAAETELFAVSYVFTGTPATAEEAKDRCALGAIAPEDETACARTIVVVDPVRAKVKVTAAGPEFAGKKAGDTLAEAAVLVPQWGRVSYLTLDVGFAGSKNVMMGLSPFGAKTSFQWKSQARAETATAALNTAATAASGFVTAIRAPDSSEVKVWQGQITELETQLKLNKLIKCQAVIQAGGTVCPDP